MTKPTKQQDRSQRKPGALAGKPNTPPSAQRSGAAEKPAGGRGAGGAAAEPPQPSRNAQARAQAAADALAGTSPRTGGGIAQGRRERPARPAISAKPAPDRERERDVLPGLKSPGEGHPDPRLPGRPPFEPTEAHRSHVETLAGFGLPHPQICQLIINPQTGKPISEKTLRLHFAAELETGVAKANSAVAQSLYKRATSAAGHQAVTAAIFWLKCRAGWKETNITEVAVSGGVLVAPSSVSPEEWIAKAASSNQEKREPGTGAG